MFNITLLRHGESEGNLAQVMQGQLDYPLTQLGIKQAECLASYWETSGTSFDLIISSPLLRASQTAEIISRKLKSPIKFDSAWMERNFGDLQGLSIEELNKRDPPIDFYHPFNPVGGYGESQFDLFNRANQALQNVLQLPFGSYLIVTHGAILNKVLYVIMGISSNGNYDSPLFHFYNTGYAQFCFDPSSNRWEVLCLNNQAIHLEKKGDVAWQTN